MKYINTQNDEDFELNEDEFEAWLEMWRADRSLPSTFQVRRRIR